LLREIERAERCEGGRCRTGPRCQWTTLAFEVWLETVALDELGCIVPAPLDDAGEDG
jgi:hypothetical protein